MESIILILLALLTGVVLWLVLSQRNFQRVDYGAYIDQEERDRQLARRMEHLDHLISDLVAYERQRRDELAAMVDSARRDLEQQVQQAKAEIIRDVLSRGGSYDELLASEHGVKLPPVPPSASQRTVGGGNENLVKFLRSPRQRQIAEMLELGHTPHEVSRFLGVSKHEVDMVGSIIFSGESA